MFFCTLVYLQCHNCSIKKPSWHLDFNMTAQDMISLLQGMMSKVIGFMKENVSLDSPSITFCPSGLLITALKQKEWTPDWINSQIPHSFYLPGQLKEVSLEKMKTSRSWLYGSLWEDSTVALLSHWHASGHALPSELWSQLRVLPLLISPYRLLGHIPSLCHIQEAWHQPHHSNTSFCKIDVIPSKCSLEA